MLSCAWIALADVAFSTNVRLAVGFAQGPIWRADVDGGTSARSGCGTGTQILIVDHPVVTIFRM